MVVTDRTGIPPLPPRDPSVLGELPASFRPSQVDSLPGSVCWFRGTWLVSTDAWEDRRLGLLDPRTGTWHELDAPTGWTRQPVAIDDGALAVFHHTRNADRGRLLSFRSGSWDVLAEDVAAGSMTDWHGARFAQRDHDGHAAALTATGELIRVNHRGEHRQIDIGGSEAAIPLPKGSTVTHLSPSPDGDRLIAVVRRGFSHRTHVFCATTGRPIGPASFRQPVNAKPMWLDADRVVLVVEQWPSLVPIVWRWAGNECADRWPAGLIGTVRSVAVSPEGSCVTALSTPSAGRHLRALDDLANPAALAVDREVRSVVVERDGQPIPCLVYEPPKALRGTVFYFPGGPHEPMWAEHSAFSRAMNDEGWRVVRANVRSSGLREERLGPKGPVRYGVDDVRDALAIIDALGEGPVVTMGMSYGGYIATMAGERSDHCRAIVVLSGFLSRRDLDGTRHPDVHRFTAEAFDQRPPEPSQLTKHVFVAHGSEDPRVPVEAVRAHASRASGSFTFVELAGQGHAILSDHDARLTYPRLLAWLQDRVPIQSRRHRSSTIRHKGDDHERLPT